MSKSENFLTIKGNGQHELVIKKSRFIASLARTDSTEAAKDFIAQISKKYHDANHNTYAYTIGLHDEQVKASDNGEPSGTAGVPELKALQLMKLKNVTAVVTRYFGGTKLGAGGLIRAYSASVTEAVKAIGVVKRVLQAEIAFEVAYPRLDELNHYLEQEGIFVADRQYGVDVTLTIYLDLDQVAHYEQELTNLLAGKVAFKKIGERYHELPIAATNYHEQI